jgi:hypothetical protein
MIQIFTNLDTLVELTKNVPITMEIPSFIGSLLTEVYISETNPSSVDRCIDPNLC